MSASESSEGSDPDVHDLLCRSRVAFADYLEGLDPEQWLRPSLCDGWTVADVAAHLSLSTTDTWRDIAIGMVRNFGNFDRWNARSARLQASTHTPGELIAILREQADSTKHSPGSSHLDQLTDVLVHGQDISRAIGEPLIVPTAPTVAALDHAVGSRWYGARKRFANIRLVATDTGWALGTGAEVRGPTLALLLLATGRTVALSEVTGAGLTTVSARMTPA